MASYFYDKHVPDYRDIDNKTGKAPGFRISICENDCGIGLSMEPFKKTTGIAIDPKAQYSGWFNIKEARELLSGLQQAIDRAISKNDGEDLHEDRVQDC